MKKQILVLSVALSALSASPAFAQLDPVDDITTGLTDPVATSTAGADGTPADILLDAGGSITLNFAGAAITVDSNNSVDVTSTATISNKNTTDAAGILVNLTNGDINATNTGCAAGITPPCHTTEGILMNGTIDLSGSGTNKTGIWLEGPTSDSGLPASNFWGNIDMTNSTMTITGDSSVGVLIDSLAIENGDISFGTLNMQTSSTSSSTLGVIGFENEGVVNGDIHVGFVDKVNDIDDIATLTINGSTASVAGGTIGLDLVGTLNGNVTIDTGSSITVSGTGAEGIVITGDINARGCDTSVPPVCTANGSLINNGIISVLGGAVSSTSNATSGSALLVSASVAGGIYNAGPTQTDDGIAAASITSTSVAGTVTITPFTGTTTPAPVVIGIYQGDTEDAGFSFYNRGLISNTAPNADQGVLGISITGTSDASTTLVGGLFNSGSIIASAVSDNKGSGTNAVAIAIGADTFIGANADGVTGDYYTYGDNGCDCFTYHGTKGINAFDDSDQAALVNLGGTKGGLISATVSSGSSFDSAVAISIGAGATVPSLINTGTISAVVTTQNTALTGLSASAIVDGSGTLNYIGNLGGTIQALVTPLDDDTQSAVAINLSADSDSSVAAKGVDIVNHATTKSSALILGDILFGKGDHQIVDVLGVGTADTAEIIGNINYGPGGVVGSDELNIGAFSTVTGKITSDSTVGVNVNVAAGGTLTITNDTAALYSAGFTIQSGATLNLTVSEDFNTGIVKSVDKDHSIYVDQDANLNITYGSWIPSSTKFILFTADDISVLGAQKYQNELNQPGTLPFLFNQVSFETLNNPDGTQSFALDVDPKSASQLGLTGYAAQMLPYASQALSNDDKLGGALINGILDQGTAQRVFGQFAPDVTGGTRAIAMSLTDQATGPVAARQRMLRMYGKDSGEVTLWGQEFAEFVKDPGNTSTGQTGYKDHGFGFALGLDGGDPKMGWYGGAVSFYSGDIVEAYPRDSHANSLWYMLTGYTDWRGKGLFLDTKVDVAYMTLKQKRYVSLDIPNTTGTGTSTFIDEADSDRPGLVGSAGFTTGVILGYGSTTLTPQMSVDAMTMRVEGATETHPSAAPGNGAGFDLATKSYYSNSARVFLGADVREDLDMGDFFIQPDVRLGYRYDFISDPEKVTAHFVSTPNTDFTITGPDPSQGNFVAGASLSATTDAWTLGANFDFVRGTNGATTEVGTIHLLGRI